MNNLTQEQYKCGHCGHIGRRRTNGFAGGWCAKCEMNDKLTKVQPKLTQEQVSELSDKDLNKRVARFFAFYYVGQNRCLTAGGDYIDLPDYCNNWNDLMPLVVELQLEQEYSEAGLTVSYFELEVHTFDSDFKTVKSPQRALSECLFLVLQEKANNE
jgi:hypothetical protein